MAKQLLPVLVLSRCSEHTVRPGRLANEDDTTGCPPNPIVRYETPVSPAGVSSFLASRSRLRAIAGLPALPRERVRAQIPRLVGSPPREQNRPRRPRPQIHRRALPAKGDAGETRNRPVAVSLNGSAD